MANNSSPLNLDTVITNYCLLIPVAGYLCKSVYRATVTHGHKFVEPTVS